jgi:hypothetical protein
MSRQTPREHAIGQVIAQFKISDQLPGKLSREECD